MTRESEDRDAELRPEESPGLLEEPAAAPVEREDEPPEDRPDFAEQLVHLLDAEDVEGAVTLARSLHPAELAFALSGIDDEIRDLVVQRLDASELADALEYLASPYREDLLEGLPSDLVAGVLAQVPDDVAADVLGELSYEQATEVVAALPEEAREAVGVLLTYEEETVGGRMTGQRISVLPTETVADVIDDMRELRPDAQTPFYLYVVDDEERLLGVANLRSLITSPPETLISEVMVTDVLSVEASEDQEEAARLLRRYRLMALPVVDGDGHLLGTVTSDDLIDVLEEEATEDIFRMAGVSADEDLTSVFRSVRFRLPWLLMNLVTAMIAAFVVSQFEGTLERVAVLAAFMPVIAGMGGNAGIQTSTVVVRSIALGRVDVRHTLPVVLHELAAGAMMGTVTGTLVGMIALLWQGNPWLGLIVGSALMGNTLVGVAAGVLIPMGLHRLRQDPALSSGIWLTMFTDVLGFIIFLGLGTVLVERLT